jgi:hypothetical protein
MAQDLDSNIPGCNTARDSTVNQNFGPGDAFGCGVDYTEGGLFFILNGQVVGTLGFPYVAACYD